MKFHNLFLITNFFLISFGISFGQTDFQLRDPEYLIDQYNQLVAKHNALIEKTRLLIIEQKQSPSSDIEQEERLRQELRKEGLWFWGQEVRCGRSLHIFFPVFIN